MKFETLIKRYKGIGYIPKGVEDEVELECLINWIYKTYNIFIFLTYHDNISLKSYRKHLNKDVNHFSAHKVWHCKTDSSHTLYSEKSFNEPFDAKFYTVKLAHSTIKAQYH